MYRWILRCWYIYAEFEYKDIKYIRGFVLESIIQEPNQDYRVPIYATM